MTTNGLGGVIVVLVVLYFIVRLAVKHGIIDAKKEDDKRNGR